MEIKAEAIRLYDKDGAWLGDIVITDEHMIAGYTDWGNFCYKWSKTRENFKEFLCRITPGYLAYKILNDNFYTPRPTKKISDLVLRLTERIIPVLQEYLRNDINNPIKLKRKRKPIIKDSKAEKLENFGAYQREGYPL
jgi:hypothetical protein